MADCLDSEPVLLDELRHGRREDAIRRCILNSSGHVDGGIIGTWSAVRGKLRVRRVRFPGRDLLFFLNLST